jgi:hypothetical protein
MYNGCSAMSQAVNRQPITVEDKVCSQASSCFGVEGGTVLQCQSLTCFFTFCLKVLDRSMSVPVLIR